MRLFLTEVKPRYQRTRVGSDRIAEAVANLDKIVWLTYRDEPLLIEPLMKLIEIFRKDAQQEVIWLRCTKLKMKKSSIILIT
jgi:hypothetical protein